MKKYFNLYLIPMFLATMFLSSCGSSSSSTSSGASGSVHHYHHGHPYVGHPSPYNRNIIIIDDVDIDYDIGIPEIMPEPMLPTLDDNE